VIGSRVALPPAGNRFVTLMAALADRLWMGPVTALRYRDRRAARTPDDPMALVLTDRTVVAHDNDVVALTFADPTGRPLPPWQPGCHLDLHLPSGLRRQYSLCGDPQDRSTYRIAVRRIPDGGGGSLQMHALAPGDTVAVRGPRNGFPFVPYPGVLYIAGGIGITPILPMVRAAQRLGLDWQFVYCGRTIESLPFLDEILGWDPARVTLRLDDDHGLPTAADLLGTAPADGGVYVCGPPPMIELVRDNIDNTPAKALHYERFSAPPVRDGTAFEVTLAGTGEVLQVPADETALDVLIRRRPDVAYSCRQGFCGTCKVRVLAGTPDHRDHRLTDAERDDSMLVCVSRSQTPQLVLDL